MPVHAQSQIPVWLNNYNPACYISLTNQENWSYLNQGLGWVSFFASLGGALNGYKDYGGRKSAVQSFMEGTYGYLANAVLYGTNTSLKPQFDGLVRCSADSFMSLTVSRPVNYYDDLIVDPVFGTTTSVKMEAEINRVNGAGAAETAQMESYAGQTHASLHDIIYTLMFQDVQPQGTVTKSSMAATYFTELHWKAVFDNLNVGGLPKPPGV